MKTGCQGAEAVKEEEQIDKARDDRKKGAPGLPGKESFPKVEDAANPENWLAISITKMAKKIRSMARPNSSGWTSIKAEQAKTGEKTMMRLYALRKRMIFAIFTAGTFDLRIHSSRHVRLQFMLRRRV